MGAVATGASASSFERSVIKVFSAMNTFGFASKVMRKAEAATSEDF
jgi:hypothetical protein